MKKFIFLIWWIACGLVAAGGFNANVRCQFRSLTSQYDYASHQSFAIFMGMIGGPISMIVVVPFTGFYYYGWTLSRDALSEKECK